MCRILAYLGEPLPVRNLLFDTDNSLVRQSYSPRMMNTFLNLAGFGMKAWDPASLRPEDPFTYRATTLPSFDRNLRFLSSKLAPTCLVAHVRGRHLLQRGGRRRDEPAPLPLRRRPRRPRAQRAPAPVPAHALRARRARAARARAAHRGDDRLRVDLRADPVAARRSLRAARRPASSPMRPPRPCASCATVRAAHGIDTSSPVNLCVSTGRAVVATRFSFDYGWYPPEDEMLETDLPFVSLWYAIGGEYARARRRLADDGRRSAPLGDHRLRAAHDRPLELARGAGVLDADRRAHRRRARVRDARPGCLTARPSTSSPPFRSSRAGRRRTWWSWRG